MAVENARPKPTLSVLDALALTVGVVVGVGIFRTPSLVASNVDSEALFLAAWVFGGVVSLIGALCYAELTTTYPHAGGDYHYLVRAFGKPVGFAFAWARMAVIQTGSIALLAFVFGDYAGQVLPLGPYGSSIYAALLIVVLTTLNLLSVQQGAGAQKVFTAVKMAGLLCVVIGGLAAAAPAAPAPPADARPAFGAAMIFVLLTFGGWNEAAFISAELRETRRNMARVLLWGIAIITVLFLLANIAYLRGLGLAEMRASDAVAADLMRRAFGETGARFVSLLVALTAVGSTNATIFTGARTNYALGQDIPLFSPLGRWHERMGTPANALLAQGLVALCLVLLGTGTRQGFSTMVDYTAPVFWLFFLLTGLSLFVLRRKEPGADRPFRVPLYPLTPLLFCATCVYMLQSSLTYTGIGALVGVAVLLAGMPLYGLARARMAPAPDV